MEAGDPDHEGDYSMQYRFNFGQLIQHYVRTFARTDPKVALRYLYLTQDISTSTHTSVFLRGAADVIIESKEVSSDKVHTLTGSGASQAALTSSPPFHIFYLWMHALLPPSAKRLLASAYGMR